MSPISTDTSDRMVTPDPTHPDAEPNTPSRHPSSSHNSGILGLASSSASAPPPYFRNTSLDDPFRDGDAPVGYFYHNSNDMHKGLNPATATHAEPQPKTRVNPLGSLPTAKNGLFLGKMVLDEGPPPPLPPRPSGLERGLQIPSRVSLITWGFSFPKILPEEGVSKEQWQLFKRELENFARISMSQYIGIVGWEILISHFATPIPAFIYGWKLKRIAEHENIQLAYDSGNLRMFEDRWNSDYFHLLGLHVRVEPPGVGEMNEMDVASSKLYKYQQKVGISSPAPGVASKGGDKKESKYQFKEGRHRMKATRKGRIIILPYRPVSPRRIPPGMTWSESHDGQSQGVTNAKAGTSFRDFAA